MTIELRQIAYLPGRRSDILIKKQVPETISQCNLSEYCHRVKKTILINEAENILYCPIPKVASTSIKLALVREVRQIVDGYNVHNSSEMLKAGFLKLRKFPKIQMQRLQKLIVVRHPFERLLSAYLDKFKTRNKWTEHFQHKYGSYIVNKYRKSHATSEEDITFMEFLEFLTDETTTCENRMNPHWAPYWILCHICRIKYNHIIRFENLTQGLNTFWLKVFGKHLNESLWTWEHKGLHDTKPLMKKYFYKLPPLLMNKLYKLYHLDFTIFGYERI